MVRAPAVKPPRIVRVVLYVRQSLDAKDDRAAVQRQVTACRRWAAERSTPAVQYVVGHVYEDNDTSATKGTRVRKDFTAMLADAKAGQFDMILSYHLDRLTRTIRDLLPLLELATNYHVGTTTVSGELDLTTDMGRLVAGILAVVAQAEVDRKAARQVLANQARADVGDPHPGARPVGYDRYKPSQGEPSTVPKLVIRETEAKLIRAAYKDVRAERKSCSEIARDFNEAGLRTTKRQTKGEGRFTHNSVKTLLTNPLYAGLKVYRGEIVGQGNWKAIVDESAWRSVRNLLTDPARRTNPRGRPRRCLGTGLYRCGVCAAAGVEQTLVAIYREDSKRIYHCRSSKHLSRVAEALDEYVITDLCTRLDRDDAKELLEDHERPDIAALHDEEQELFDRLDKAAAMFAKKQIGDRQLRIITAGLRSEIEVVQAAMTHTDRAAVLKKYVEADSAREVWDDDTIDGQRAVLGVLANVTVQKGRPGGNSRNGPHPLDPSTVRIDWL